MEPRNNQPGGEQSEPVLSADINTPQDPNAAAPTTPAEEKPSEPTVSEIETPEGEPVVQTAVEPGPNAAETGAEKTVPDLAAASSPAAPLPEPGMSQPAAEGASGPVQPGVVISGGSSPVPRKRRWLLPAAIAAVLLLLLGGGYLYAFYLPNRPSAIYATSLKRTGEGLDALVNYSNTVSKKGYKSYAVTSTINSTGSAGFDGSLNGAADASGNSSFKLGLDVLGEKMNANIESVHVGGSNTPDIYVQLTGIKKELDSFGLGSVDSLDGKWVAIDHTLINTYVTQLDEQASGLTKGSLVPTQDQVNDAVHKVQVVNKQYVFTTDESKAVLANEKFLGKQTKDGRETYHYTVSYNKAHLKAYVSALGTALDSSSLNDWAKASSDGKRLSQSLDIQSLQKAVDRAKTGYMFDVWVDAKTKLIHTVSFASPGDGSVYSLTQNYTGGTVYPFALHVSSKDPSNGERQTSSMDMALDTGTDSYKGELTADEGKDTHVKFNFTITPSKKGVVVVAPKNAEPVMSLLSEWGLSANEL